MVNGLLRRNTAQHWSGPVRILRCALAVASLAVLAHRAVAQPIVPAPTCGVGSSSKVAVDVGHTLSQPGATSARGVGEFEYNRRLAGAVGGVLAQRGVATVLIGEAGTPLSLTGRTRLAQAAGASLFLSLHHDSVQPHYLSTWIVDGQPRAYSDVFHGYSVFVSAGNARAGESLRFATLLGNGMREAGFTPSLHHAEPIAGEGRPLLDPRIGLYRFDGLAVLRTAAMPAALLEAGVIVNRAEEEQLRSPAVLARMADAIAGAVQRYCAEGVSLPMRPAQPTGAGRLPVGTP